MSMSLKEMVLTQFSAAAKTNPPRPNPFKFIIDRTPKETFLPQLLEWAHHTQVPLLSVKHMKAPKGSNQPDIIVFFPKGQNDHKTWITIEWKNDYPHPTLAEGANEAPVPALMIRSSNNHKGTICYMNPTACPKNKVTVARAFTQFLAPHIPDGLRGSFLAQVEAFEERYPEKPKTWAQRVRQFFCAPIL